MSAKALGCALVLVLVFAVSAALADGTWYDLHEQYAAESSLTAAGIGQVGKIEVAPGVRVRADLWDDDYVPTYQDLISVGFLPEDAGEISNCNVTWGRIKACMSKPDPQKCLSEKNGG